MNGVRKSESESDFRLLDDAAETGDGMMLSALADQPGEAEAAMILNAMVDDPEQLKREAGELIERLKD